MPAFNCPKHLRPSYEIGSKHQKEKTKKQPQNNKKNDPFKYELFFPSPNSNICYAANKYGILICKSIKLYNGETSLQVLKKICPLS